jgi:hypothetical protein
MVMMIVKKDHIRSRLFENVITGNKQRQRI